MKRDHLAALENQSIFILREAFASFQNIAMLWSVGKDSTALLWLARKAFLGRVPFPLVHIDTGYKIPEMIEYRDRLAREWNLQLVVARNEEALAAGATFPAGRLGRVDCCTALKKNALQQLLAARGYAALIVGIRRDEEPTRAKERYFSPRRADMGWEATDQPPEFWDQFNTTLGPGTHVRVHPLLHWSELDIWEYIERERIPLVPLYFDRGGGERYRSLGCAPCTASIPSRAATAAEVVVELKGLRTAERAVRAQDRESDDGFERLRRDGYM